MFACANKHWGVAISSGFQTIQARNDTKTMKVSYNWLKEFFPKSSTCLDKPEELAKKLTNFGLEVSNVEFLENDTCLDIEITANRGDCLSHLGIAREIAAIYNLRLSTPGEHLPKRKGTEKNLPFKIEIETKKNKPPFCSRYFAQVIQGVKIAPSPSWLAERLSLCGIRPINNIVDITNYVLLELGQPLHAFDYQLITNQQIIVRWAKKGERIVGLDEKDRILDENIPVIADAKRAIALAGIIGGKETAVSENTRDILLESAYFDPRAIRRAAKKLGITTESSYRFERSIDWENVRSANERAAYLLEQMASGKLQTKNIDRKSRPHKPKKVIIEFKEVNNLLGTKLKPKEIVSPLRKLGLILEQKKNTLKVKVPSYRNDLSREVDLVEEIARLYGYENIPSIIGSLRPGNYFESTVSLKEKEVEKEIRQFMFSSGLNEVVNYSLLSQDALEEFAAFNEQVISLRNPLSQETAYLRTTLLPELLRNAIDNSHYQIENIKIYEIGKVHFKEEKEFKEEKILAGLITGEEEIKHWRTKPGKIDFYHLRGLLDSLFLKLGIKNYKYQEIDIPYFNPDKAFEIRITEKENPAVIGKLGEFAYPLLEKYEFCNNLYLFEINLELLANLANLEKTYSPLPKYPFIQRDLSFIIGENIYQDDVSNLISQNGGEYLKHCELIDLYKNENIPAGHHSITYRLTYSNPKNTLTTEEVEKSEEEIIHTLEKEFKAQIRKI